MTLFEVKVPIFRTDIYHLIWRPSTFAACQSSLRPTRQLTYELVRALLGGFRSSSALLAESESGFLTSSRLDLTSSYYVRLSTSCTRSAISVLGGLPGSLVFGGSPDASFPEVLLDGLVLGGSSRCFVSGSSS